MKIQFDTAFNSSYLCQPVYTIEGKLLAVELICRFSSADSKLVMPTELVLNLLTPQQLLRFLTEQQIWACEHAQWFTDNQVILNISVEEKQVALLLEDENLRNAFSTYTFIHLNLSESFPRLSEGRNNEQVVALNKYFPLWLENFGSGSITMAPIFDHLFQWVKLDKNLFWQLYEGENFTIVMPSLVRNVSRFCRNIVVDGLDSQDYFDALRKADIQGMKGLLWPGVEPAELDSLLIRPAQFH
ncbi:EAL domain-containing protein [Rahnella sp. SL6]|uniref:EAL domain-containing protein n=2 Tax=Yersiniaceae TaxID=1903411 RepID=A0ABS6L783_9GAMM|nr:EAL domain-containing protein [Rahnella perminowiae]MBU9825564.1 EAL domain-containing protein [Rahnella perminowiae]MBU9837272.1 EAL domain-containing protein [Rahnella perminowiae]UJD91711.1 EAL domain-containing protein [Rahnella aquatilis]